MIADSVPGTVSDSPAGLSVWGSVRLGWGSQTHVSDMFRHGTEVADAGSTLRGALSFMELPLLHTPKYGWCLLCVKTLLRH